MDINKLLAQAQKMERELQKANEELEAALFEGSASNGLVKITLKGNNEVVEVNIDENILNKEDKEMIQDLIMIAFNDAISKLESKRNEKLSQTTGGLNIPGL